MQHVKQIRELIAQGEVPKAHSALENLLALGPKNIEALKLRAQLLNMEGRFSEEAKVWDLVHNLDPEDPDGVAFVLRCHLEERENIYFSEELPGIGRRFITYPRTLVSTSLMGLFGCLAFLTYSKVSIRFTSLAEPGAMLGAFAFLVLVPWVLILISYLKTSRYLIVHRQGVTLAKRIGKMEWSWHDFAKVVLVHDPHGIGKNLLSLAFIPKDPAQRALEVNLTPDQGSVRARTALVREVANLFATPEHIDRELVAKDLIKPILL